jgi:hypothetical protein
MGKATIAVVSLLVGLGVGYLIWGKKDNGHDGHPLVTPVVHQIVIGQNPDWVSVVISKGNQDQVVWTSNAGQPLQITFPKDQFSGGPPPFAGMMLNGNEYGFSTCAAGKCSSGPIHSDFKPSSTSYKYNQTLDGVLYDGRIIINR